MNADNRNNNNKKQPSSDSIIYQKAIRNHHQVIPSFYLKGSKADRGGASLN